MKTDCLHQRKLWKKFNSLYLYLADWSSYMKRKQISLLNNEDIRKRKFFCRCQDVFLKIVKGVSMKNLSMELELKVL